MPCGHVDVLRRDSPVPLGAPPLGALWPPLAAQARSSVGPGDPERLQPLRGSLKGELHRFAFPEAAEALHVQFALSTREREREREGQNQSGDPCWNNFITSRTSRTTIVETFVDARFCDSVVFIGGCEHPYPPISSQKVPDVRCAEVKM